MRHAERLRVLVEVCGDLDADSPDQIARARPVEQWSVREERPSRSSFPGSAMHVCRRKHAARTHIENP
eukprot:8237075-Pyramimonas_sp.AAC.1